MYMKIVEFYPFTKVMLLDFVFMFANACFGCKAELLCSCSVSSASYFSTIWGFENENKER